MAVSSISSTPVRDTDYPTLSTRSTATEDTSSTSSASAKALIAKTGAQMAASDSGSDDDIDPVTGLPRSMSGGVSALSGGSKSATRSATASSNGATASARTGGVENIGTQRAASLESMQTSDGYASRARSAKSYSVKSVEG